MLTDKSNIPSPTCITQSVCVYDVKGLQLKLQKFTFIRASYAYSI